MNLPKIFSAAGSVAFLMIIVGCSKAPDQKITEAKNAILQAENAGAYQFSKEEFSSAKETFDSAMSAVAVENKKLPFLRKYDNAISLLAKVEELAGSASESAKAAKEQIRAEQEKALREADAKKKSGKTPSTVKAVKGKTVTKKSDKSPANKTIKN